MEYVGQVTHGILWLFTVGVLTQFVVISEIERWTVATGESVFAGMGRLTRRAFWPWFFLAATLVSFFWPGWAAESAAFVSTVVSILTDTPPLPWQPIALVMGVPWQDSGTVGSLLGTRMVLNEFIAYAELGPMKETLDPRSFTIASFALAGFANFSSVGIQLGGIGALVPDRKRDLARLGIRAMLAGTLANFLSATIAGMLL